MVRGDAALQAGQEFAVLEHGQVLVRDVLGPPLDEVGDRGDLVGLGQPQPRGQALLYRRVAAGPAEDELDGGQQTGRVEPGHHVGPVRRPGPDRARATGTSAPAGAARAPAGMATPAAAAGAAAPGRGHLLLSPLVPLRHPGQLRVDPGAGRIGEQVVQPGADHHVLPQRHRAVLVHDDRDPAAHAVQPVAELLGVADRGGQRDQRHRLGQVDDDLFPYRAARPVGQVVHLVQHHETEAREGGRPGIEHVAQHFGGHDHDRRLAVDAVVPGEQADRLAVVAADQVGVFLVGKGLDRRGVEALEAAFQGQVHGELTDHGLAGAGGSGDEDPVAIVQGGAGLELEVVEFEVVQPAEAGQLRVGLPITEGRVPLSRGPRGRFRRVIVSPVERRGHTPRVGGVTGQPGRDPRTRGRRDVF